MMEQRTFGRTDLKVGVVGIGTEHWVETPQSEVVEMVRRSLDVGANFFECIPAQTHLRDFLGLAFRGVRDRAVIAGHIGVYEDGSQVGITRDVAISIAHFEDLLRRLGTDYVDILNIIFVDELEDVERVLGPGGLMDAAQKLKVEGKARYIQVSCHKVPAALRLVETGLVDSMMFSINPLFDILPGSLDLNDCWNEDRYKALRTGESPRDRQSLYLSCQQRHVPIVVMKPFAGGWLFAPHLYSDGVPLTPVQCIHYALSRPAVATVAFGSKRMSELDAALAYATSSPIERAYAARLEALKWRPGSLCLYCNHCLPCPAGIDIGATLKLADEAEVVKVAKTVEVTAKAGAAAADLASRISALTGHPSQCTSCGVCSDRCPFGVDVATRMAEAIELFGLVSSIGSASKL